MPTYTFTQLPNASEPYEQDIERVTPSIVYSINYNDITTDSEVSAMLAHLDSFARACGYCITE